MFETCYKLHTSKTMWATSRQEPSFETCYKLHTSKTEIRENTEGQ